MSKTKQYVLCAMFAALIGIGAFIKLPIFVVPFTLQFLFVNLAALLLGRKYGGLAVVIYLMVGLIGIPVFTKGGGPSYIFQPTFGYLIGFAVGAFVAGHLVDTFKVLTIKNLLLASFTNLGIVYAFGLVYYYVIANYYLDSSMGVWALLWYCFAVTVPGDIMWCFVSASLAKRVKMAIR